MSSSNRWIFVQMPIFHCVDQALFPILVVPYSLSYPSDSPFFNYCNAFFHSYVLLISFFCYYLSRYNFILRIYAAQLFLGIFYISISFALLCHYFERIKLLVE